jgi:hypothetical protein
MSPHVITMLVVPGVFVAFWLLCAIARSRVSRAGSSASPPGPSQQGVGPGVELAPAAALELSGLSAEHGARVLLLTTAGSTGLAVVDPDGDGAHEQVEHLYRTAAGTWVAAGGSGGPGGEYGVHDWGEYPTRAGREGARWAYGRAYPPGRHTVTIGGRTVHVTAGRDLWWAWLQPLGGADRGEPAPTDMPLKHRAGRLRAG